MLTTLFNKRRALYETFLIKQAKYIVNDHATLIVLAFVSALAIGYAQLLQHVTSDHKEVAKIALSLFFFVAVKYGKLITFVKEADVHFLRVSQQEWQLYFKKAKWYSFLLPSVVLVGAVIVAMPLLMKIGALGHAIGLGILLFWLKWIDLTRIMQRLTACQHSAETVLFSIGTWGSIALMLWQFDVLAVLLGGALYGYLWFRDRHVRTYDLEKVITYEQKRLNHVYRMLSLFVRVPHVKTVVKRRRYFERFYRYTTNAYSYAFQRAFVRSDVYLPLVIRLSVVMSVAGVMVNQIVVLLAIMALGTVATVVQLLPLYQQYDYHVVLQMAPVSLQDKKKGFLAVAATIVSLQAILTHGVALVFSGRLWLGYSLLAVIGILCVTLALYVRPKLDKI